MIELNFSAKDNLALVLERIKNEESAEIKIRLKDNSEILQSPINERIIKHWATKWNKRVHIEPTKPEDQPHAQQPGSKSTTSTPEKGKPLHKVRRKKWRITPRQILIIAITSFLVFSMSSLAFVYFYLPRATITLYVAESELSQERTITVDPQSSGIDYERLVIPGEKVEVEDTQSKKFDATGTKVTGEKATGTVTLVNKTTVAITLKAGQELTNIGDSTNAAGLKFILQENATVDPKATSYTEIEGRRAEVSIFGERENLSVTATEIGERYNLPQGTQFSIDGYSTDEIYAESESNFSGGSTTELTIVSTEDQNQAREELAAQIFASNKQSLSNKVTRDQQLLTETIKDTIQQTTFSHKVGTETSSFTTTVTGKSTATVFSRADIKELLTQKIQENIPQGFELSGKDTAVTIEALNVDPEDRITLMGTIRATVVPEFDKGQLKDSLKGLKPQQAEETLLRLDEISGYRIDLWPRLPRILQTLPHRWSRIEINIEIKQED